MKIEKIDNLPMDIENKMWSDLKKYDNLHGIEINHRRFALLLKTSHNDVIGVLQAYTVFAEIYVDELWVSTDHRRKGFGKMLLQELETIFDKQGYWNINLCTSEFQAPEFYKKCGYTLEFVRKNEVNPKLTKYFFVKYFKDQPQFQGTR